MLFQNRTALITGASRGIGKSIALKLASQGANIIIAAKSVEEDERLGGTIYSTAKEVEAAGGKAFPVYCDIRDELLVEKAVTDGAAHFGGIDILVNNASAISLDNTDKIPLKRFNLMMDINVKGTFFVTKYCLPYLKKGSNPHILTLSPPLNMDLKWLKPHIAYTLSKYSMSLLTLGWAAEFKEFGIAANALWPVTTVATSAVRNVLGGDKLMKLSRTPEIMADAAFYLLQRDATTVSGNCFLDEEVMQEAGINDLSSYAVTPGGPLYKDLFL